MIRIDYNALEELETCCVALVKSCMKRNAQRGKPSNQAISPVAVPLHKTQRFSCKNLGWILMTAFGRFFSVSDLYAKSAFEKRTPRNQQNRRFTT